jgi:hypothetical protein
LDISKKRSQTVGQNHIPSLFNISPRLLEDELLDIYENGVLNTWQKQFLLQGFDPIEHTKQEFLEFCERLEATEDIFVENQNSKPRGNTKKNGFQKDRKNPVNRVNRNSTGTSLRFCRLHGQQHYHNTGSCKVLLDQAAKLKATFKT